MCETIHIAKRSITCDNSEPTEQIGTFWIATVSADDMTVKEILSVLSADPICNLPCSTLLLWEGGQ